MSVLNGPGENFAHPSIAGVPRHTQRSAFDGRGVALALGGGFSRGFAHLGVLEVLEQENIPIAAIVGTSIGSLLGAAYADRIPIRQLCELGRRVRIRDFIRSHNALPNSYSSDCIGEFVDQWLHSSQVEELPIPTAIVTTDLQTFAAHVFTRGSLDVAIRASCAFPGIFKPVEHEGHLLADGCLVAPVPTAVAAQMGANCVLGVVVGSNSNHTSSRGNVVQVFDRNLRNGSSQNGISPSWIRHADILLEPEVHLIDWTDFSRVDEACAAGARAMRLALPRLREVLARGCSQEPDRAAPEPDKKCVAS
jgi:NTE family protein